MSYPVYDKRTLQQELYMSLGMFRSLTALEQNMILEEINKLDFKYPDSVTFDLESYYEARLKARKPDRVWPEKLSKKEIAICKLTYLQDMITEARKIEGISSSYVDLFNIISLFLKEVEKECYKPSDQQPLPEGTFRKYTGIPADVAPLVNTIYKVMIANYQKKFQY